MDWLSDFWRGLAALAVGGTLVAGVVTLVSKLAIEKFFEAASIRYKAEIQLAHDRELEELRSQLRSSEARGSRVHERQLNVIEEIFTALVTAQLAAEAWIQPFQSAGALPPEELGKAAADSFNDLVRKLEFHRIWLPAALCDQLQDYAQEVKKSLIDFHLKESYRQSEQTEVWGRAWDGLRDRAGPLKRGLEDEFRRVLKEGPGPD